MENQEKIIKSIQKWALDKKIAIYQMDWPQKFNLKIHDYLIKLNLDRVEYQGRGTDVDENTAIIKAFAECIERYIVIKQGLFSSNGCAVHTDLESAKVNAKKELIERDVFSLFYLYNLKKEKIKKPIGQSDALDFIFKSKDKVLQYILPNDSYSVVLSIIMTSGATI